MTQLLLYLVAGSLATGIDLLIYNFLAAAPFRLRRVPAHLISTACAMLFGFTLHFLLVFRPPEPMVLERVVRYVLTVCCSAYILQTFIIFSLTSVWTAPVQAARGVWSLVGNKRENDFLERNFVKGCAIGCGLVFNFVSFKFFVYAN